MRKSRPRPIRRPQPGKGQSRRLIEKVEERLTTPETRERESLNQLPDRLEQAIRQEYLRRSQVPIEDWLFEVIEVFVTREIEQIRSTERHREALSLGLLPDLDCGRGCNHCCFQHVAISPIETVVLARQINRHWSEEQIDNLRERLVRDAELYRQTRSQSPDEASERQALKRIRRPCPLLDEVSGDCLAYQWRPITCRRENSIDARVCESYRKNPDQDQSSIRLTALDLIWGGVQVGLTRISGKLLRRTQFGSLSEELRRALGH